MKVNLRKKDIQDNNNNNNNNNNNTSVNNFNYHVSLKNKSNLPIKPILLSFFLLIVGSCFMYLGVILTLSRKYLDSIPSLILGILCIIPGSYYSFIIIQILRGIPDYSFELLLE